MYHDFTYEAVLGSSLRAQWDLDDVLRADQELDFSRRFMPESLARSSVAPGLTPDEQLILNQISANQYICMFGTVEEFILPFLLDHARPMLGEDDFRIRALLNFASEEAKHIHLFKRFHEAFVRGFPVEHEILGPTDALGRAVLKHHPLAVGLAILMIEWMTQQHYLGSIRDDGDIDPLFKNLLKNHWMEEAQHAKLDTLIVDALAEGLSEDEIDKVMDEFFVILGYFDRSLKVQGRMNVEALERALGRTLVNRRQLVAHQYAAGLWTFIGSGLIHPRFKATLEHISSRAAARVARLVAENAQAVRRPGGSAATALESA
jgi:hypothetical protein